MPQAQLQTYRDSGPGVLRPIALQLGGGPVPGLCSGLRAGLEGMRVGGRRRFAVPPELGFGSDSQVLAPYAVVPPGAELVRGGRL
jgi:FKBP-type peptidyl-prolyl cis-trans isomerase